MSTTTTEQIDASTSTRGPVPTNVAATFPHLDVLAGRHDADPHDHGRGLPHTDRLTTNYPRMTTWRGDLRAAISALLSAFHDGGVGPLAEGTQVPTPDHHVRLGDREFASLFDAAVTYLDPYFGRPSPDPTWVRALRVERERHALVYGIESFLPDTGGRERLVGWMARSEHDEYRRQVDADVERIAETFHQAAIQHSLCSQYDAVVDDVNAVLQVLHLDPREVEHEATVSVRITADLTHDGLVRLGLDRWAASLSVSGTVGVSVSWTCQHNDTGDCEEAECYEVDMEGYSTYFTVTDYEIA